MTVTNPTNKVLIIGAGPGGLVLAHCLRKHGIPYEIFEREKASQPRKQGWAVGLQEYVTIYLERNIRISYFSNGSLVE